MSAATKLQLVPRLYRAYLRICRQLIQSDTPVLLAPPMQLCMSRYGSGRMIVQNERTALELQRALFPGIDFAKAALSGRCLLYGSEIKQLVRMEFRNGSSESVPAVGSSTTLSSTEYEGLERESDDGEGGFAYSLPVPSTNLDAGIQHLRTLSTLRDEATTSSLKETEYHGKTDATVRVQITTMRLPDHGAAQDKHQFLYRIRVTNLSNTTVQLVGRQWTFTDAAGDTLEVPKGSRGVVGLTPVLPVRRPYGLVTLEYVSGTELKTPTGSMRGSFQMYIPATQENFDAIVTETQLK